MRDSLVRHELAAVLDGTGNFDVGDFKGRPTLQKTVCIPQSFWINPGYKFAGYLHGAYCTALARDGLAIEPAPPSMPKIDISFEADAAQRRCAEFRLRKYKKHDPAMPEIASPMCRLDGVGTDKGGALRSVEGKNPGRGAEQCGRAWRDLEKCGVAGGSRHG